MCPEPLEKWRKSVLLSDFYKNPGKFALPFQNFVAGTLLDRELTIAEQMDDTIGLILAERSVESALHVFIPLIHKEGHLTESEVSLLYHVNYAYKAIVPAPTHRIFLLTAPEECQRRQQRRNREEEEELELSYFQSVHKLHQQWIPLENSQKVTIVTSVDDGLLAIMSIIKAHEKKLLKLL